MDCVARHKKDKECEGVRPRSSFVPLAQMDINHLLNDYTLLENAHMQAGTSFRDSRFQGQDVDVAMTPRFRQILGLVQKYDPPLKLELLPAGLSLHKKNSTVRKGNNIFWRIDVTFAKAETTVTSHKFCDDWKWRWLLEQHLLPGGSQEIQGWLQTRKNLRKSPHDGAKPSSTGPPSPLASSSPAPPPCASSSSFPSAEQTDVSFSSSDSLTASSSSSFSSHISSSDRSLPLEPFPSESSLAPLPSPQNTPENPPLSAPSTTDPSNNNINPPTSSSNDNNNLANNNDTSEKSSKFKNRKKNNNNNGKRNKRNHNNNKGRAPNNQDEQPPEKRAKIQDTSEGVDANALTRHRLKAYHQAEFSSLRIFIQIPFRPANKPAFQEINLDSTVAEFLAGKRLIEYPCVFVALPDEVGLYPVE